MKSQRSKQAAIAASVSALLLLGSPGIQDPAGATAATRSLRAQIQVAAPPSGIYRPGQRVLVSGALEAVALEGQEVIQAEPASGSLFLQVRTPSGDVRGPFGPFQTSSNGRFQVRLPASATDGIVGRPEHGYKAVAALEAIRLAYDGMSVTERSARTGILLAAAPKGLTLENSFVSSVGWVKPGNPYTFRVFVRNFAKKAFRRARVRIPRVKGAKFTRVLPAGRSGRARIRRGTVRWNIGKVPAAVKGNPTIKTLVVQARAKNLKQDPRIVWRNLSSKATLTYKGGRRRSVSRGPKVIPPNEIYDTARYGDRPFPVVPVDYFDRQHTPEHSGQRLANIINSRKVKGSTFNLYQEMSYKQLFPHGTVPSAGIATAGFDVKWKSEHRQTAG